ncbi:MAG: hypothetical protein ACK41D_03130 [Rubricoccaceae bacterium]
MIALLVLSILSVALPAVVSDGAVGLKKASEQPASAGSSRVRA